METDFVKIPVANHANNRDKIFTIFMDHHINKFHNPTALLESEEGNAADDGVRLAELPLVRRIERIVFARSLCDGPLRRCDAIGVGFDRAGGEAGGDAGAGTFAFCIVPPFAAMMRYIASLSIPVTRRRLMFSTRFHTGLFASRS